MYLNNTSIQNTVKSPPLKRLRVGRKLLKELTEAVNSPLTATQKTHPLGDMLKTLRVDAGASKRYQFASILGITDQTLQKLENQPLTSGSKPMLKLLESFGLALTLDVPDLDTSLGYPDLHEAFFSLRCRNAHLTQRELGDHSCVARTTIQNFESGKPIKLSVLLKMVSVMDARVMIVPADQVKAGVTITNESTNEELDARDKDVHTFNDHDIPLDRYAPTLADMLKRRSQPMTPEEDERARRCERSNVKRASWYWDGARRRWPTKAAS